MSIQTHYIHLDDKNKTSLPHFEPFFEVTPVLKA